MAPVPGGFAIEKRRRPTSRKTSQCLPITVEREIFREPRPRPDPIAAHHRDEWRGIRARNKQRVQIADIDLKGRRPVGNVA